MHYPIFTIHYPLSNIHYQYPLSNIHYPISTIQFPLSNIHYPISNIHYPISTIQYLISTIRYPPFTIDHLSSSRIHHRPSIFHSPPWRTCNPSESGQSELVRINPNLLTDRIRSIRVISINSNETDFLEIIRIDLDRPDSFALKVRIDRIDDIHSDWKFRLIRIHRIIRIKSD